MAQEFLHELGVDATGEQDGGARVPEIVEADVRQFGSLEKRLEQGPGYVVGIQGPPAVGTKDEPVILPEEGPCVQAFGVLWVALWALSASVACRVSLMERSLPFLGVVKTGPLLAVDLVRLTRSVASLDSRSTSCQRRARSSRFANRR